MLWKINRKNPLMLFSFYKNYLLYTARVYYCTYSPNGTFLASGTAA